MEFINVFNKNDWSDWFAKLKWQLISFKFLSFVAVLILLVLTWLSLDRLFLQTVELAKDLKTNGFISEEGVKEIILRSQVILYDNTFSHLMITAGAVLASIIAIKGVSYVVDGNKLKDMSKAIEASSGDTSKVLEDLKRFLPKRGA